MCKLHNKKFQHNDCAKKAEPCVDDLVETQNGDWWSVMLAKRLVDGYTLLARETFMTPVEFEKQEGGTLTPVYNKGVGKLLMEQKRPDLPWTPVDPVPLRDEFESKQLASHWNFLRTPYTQWYELSEGTLEVQLRTESENHYQLLKEMKCSRSDPYSL